MPIILVGLNHRTAPLELREQLSLAGCALPMALDDLQALSEPVRTNGMKANQNGLTVHEGVILSTCNRLEIYATTNDPNICWMAIAAFIAGLQNIPPQILHPHLYFLENQAATRHLMRVASGLDSMILGETQILGQVSRAYQDAHAARTTGTILSHLFAQAIHTGKRARTETAISQYTTSVSHAAAHLVRVECGHLAEKRVLVIGAGEMATLAAQALQAEGAQDITFMNRTYTRAEALANKAGGKALSWRHFREALASFDVIVSVTGAPHTVIYSDDVEEAIPERTGRPLTLVDIAVPRDVEAKTRDLPGVQLFDIDDLQSMVDKHKSIREAAIPAVDAIIDEEVSSFFDWLNSRQITPIISDLREWAQSLAQAEVEQALNRLDERDQHIEEVVSRLAHRLVNKILHEPTVRLKAQAAQGNGQDYADAVRELFDLTASDSSNNGNTGD